MNTSLRIDELDELVSDDADAIITAEVSRRFPPCLLDDLYARSHRLSAADLAERINAMQGQTYVEIRAGLQQILTELELHRWGFDLGYEAGYDERSKELRP